MKRLPPCDHDECGPTGCKRDALSCSAPATGSVSLAELEQFALEMGIDESECLVGDHGVGFAFGFADAVAQLTAFIQRKKQNRVIYGKSPDMK